VTASYPAIASLIAACQPRASRGTGPQSRATLRAGQPSEQGTLVVDVRVRAGRTLVWACVGAEGTEQRTPIWGVPSPRRLRLEVDRMDVDGRIPSMELEKQTHLLQEPRSGENPILYLVTGVCACARGLCGSPFRETVRRDAFSRSRTRAPIVVGLHVAVRPRVCAARRSAQRRAEACGTRNVLWPSSAL
jgi:hypothetical protein